MGQGTRMLRHEALLCRGESEAAETLVPFALSAVEAGDEVVATLSDSHLETLRDALGADAARVTLRRASDWYQTPARTIAGCRDLIDDRRARGARRVLAIGQIPSEDSAEARREWVRYEAAVNHVFARDDLWAVCLYDTRTLPADVVREAARTHPRVIRDGRRMPSRDYIDPRRLLAELASPAPAPSALPLVDVPVDGDLPSVRRLLRDVAEGAGLRDDALEQLTVAVNEAMTNALVHGDPPVRLRVLRDEDSLVCEVEDVGGAMSDLLAGYVPPAVDRAPERGMGLWLARQLCDHVTVHPAEDRTVVRLVRCVGSS